MIAAASDIAEFKLTDLLSGAGATIGVIIAGVIFLQFLSSKYNELLNRYHTLTSDYRKGGAAETRHGILQSQIRLFRLRMRLINWASWIAAGAVNFFIIAVIAGGMSMVFPEAGIVKWIGACGLFLGLIAIAAAVFVKLYESVLARHDGNDEAGDLDDPAKRSAF
ncbi:MAG: DUF2721 domain-containing protein [Gemmataceae bacterium]|nr:DUF2721 domain-containing protein [Gemmataceae bacterium]